ncbi:MAG: hypothetical protein KF767_04790 [Bdellovibrionaceae bacterium]|nr:hypothetical protein [Pseudobdellovibrionaceae bacterium]
MRLFFLILFFPLALLAQDGHEGHDHGGGGLDGLNFLGAADLFLPVHSDQNQVDENRLRIRSAELSISGSVDQYFEGTLTFAGHSHGGNFLWDVHEAYLRTNDYLWENTEVKVGKFLLGIGRLNQIHQHEWLFTEAPRVHRQFFAEEAAMDTGAEVRHRFNETFNLTAGVTNGYCYGHCDQLGRRPLAPVHYLRGEVATDDSRTGLNYWGYTDFSGERVWHTGVDFVWKKMSHGRAKHLIQTETYYRNKIPELGAASVHAGTYLYYQRTWNRRLSSGLRADLFSELNRRWELVDEKRDNLDYALTLNSTYRAGEYSTLRGGLVHEALTQRGVAAVVDNRVELQLVYLLGSHPPHGF